MDEDRRKQATLEERKQVIFRKLREFCHQPGCSQVHECPRSHPACDSRLGLDTAIARVAISILHREDSLQYRLPQMRTLLEVVSYHRLEFNTLHQALYAAMDLLVSQLS